MRKHAAQLAPITPVATLATRLVSVFTLTLIRLSSMFLFRRFFHQLATAGLFGTSKEGPKRLGDTEGGEGRR